VGPDKEPGGQQHKVEDRVIELPVPEREQCREKDAADHAHRHDQHEVQAEVRKLIDIVTGEMLVMKTPAYVLRDVHFSCERQLFNSQYEPLFWRSIWLRRVTD
jgi:hypothetical protein